MTDKQGESFFSSNIRRSESPPFDIDMKILLNNEDYR